MNTGQSQLTRRGDGSGVRDSSLMVDDLIEYLSRLARLNRGHRTGNQELSDGLQQLARALRPHAGRTISEFADQIRKMPGRSHATASKQKATLPPSIESLSQEEIETMLNCDEWRILVVKDVLAMIRIVLWCPRKEWASSSNEIDLGLRNTSAEFWSGRVIQDRIEAIPTALGKMPHGSKPRSMNRRRSSVFSEGTWRSRAGLKRLPSHHGSCERNMSPRSCSSTRSKAASDDRPHSRPRRRIWPPTETESWCSTRISMRRA